MSFVNRKVLAAAFVVALTSLLAVGSAFITPATAAGPDTTYLVLAPQGNPTAKAAARVAAAGGTVVATVEIYDRCEAHVDLRVPNVSLADYRAPENYHADQCPLCEAGTPITRF